jgi:hypothetical protein
MNTTLLKPIEPEKRFARRWRTAKGLGASAWLRLARITAVWLRQTSRQMVNVIKLRSERMLSLSFSSAACWASFSPANGAIHVR